MKKLVASLMAAALVVSSLAACGNKGGADTTTAKAETTAAQKDETTAAEGEGDVLTLYVATWESSEMNQAIQKACDEVFSVKNPDIKVVVLDASYSDYGQSMISMIQAGDDLDIMQLGHDMGRNYYESGLVYDWGEIAANDADFMAGFFPGALDGWSFDDVVYGLPGLANVYGVFYNKDILDAKGIDYPSADWTWDDLFAMAEQLKDPAAGTYGIYGLPTDVFGLSQISVGNGGAKFVDRIVNPEGVTVDEEMIKAAEMINGYIADGTLPSRTYDGKDNQSNFESGQTGLLWYGQWEINSLINNCPDLNWGYAPCPAGSKGVANLYDYTGYGANAYRTAEHPEETWKLLKFLASEAYETVLKVSPVAACSYNEYAQVFFDTVEAAGHADAAEAVRVMMDSENKVACRFVAAWKDDCDKIWNTDYNNLLDNGGDFADTLTKLAEKVNAYIDAQ